MIYISGRITGNKNYELDFMKAEILLLMIGYPKEQIINPLRIGKEVPKLWETEIPSYEQYMIHDIHKLVFCDEIYMLRGWWRSKGARLERHIAKVLGMKIIYQKRGDI